MTGPRRPRSTTTTAVVLFTRDLRVRDNPALAEAARTAERVVPLFVLEQRLLRRSPARSAFLAECLRDLDGSLRRLGGRLVVRRGRAVTEVARVAREAGAQAVFLAADVSAFAQRREAALRRALPALDVHVLPGHFVVEPGDVAPVRTTHYRVFTPYLRAWEAAPWRPAVAAPIRLVQPDLASCALPEPRRGAGGQGPRGGETAGRQTLHGWLRRVEGGCGELRDVPAADATSRLSPYLRFGCVSAVELAGRAGPGAFRRQLCWRDFFAQVLWANPRSQHDDLVPGRRQWRDDDEALAAWREGATGYPLVDAGMRQLEREGFMHNRARLVVASFLTKHLGLDWRLGAAHFDRLLLDGDPASNTGNWQWVAGTGTDTRPGRILSPARQAERFDPDGAYVRRYVGELSALDAAATLRPGPLDAPGYPPPVVDHDDAVRRFRASG